MFCREERDDWENSSYFPLTTSMAEAKMLADHRESKKSGVFPRGTCFMLFSGCRERFAPLVSDGRFLPFQNQRKVGAKLGAKTLDAYRFDSILLDKNALSCGGAIR
jgi:hypothetical protein